MRNLNCDFFDEFKKLDNILKDIYRENSEGKLGITLYLCDMDNNFSQGSKKIMGWEADYKRLKHIRHIRNELAHSNISLSDEICSKEDIDFVRDFRNRIINQADPISCLHKISNQPRNAPQEYSMPKSERYGKSKNIQYNDNNDDTSIGNALVCSVILLLIVFIGAILWYLST